MSTPKCSSRWLSFASWRFDPLLKMDTYVGWVCWVCPTRINCDYSEHLWMDAAPIQSFLTTCVILRTHQHLLHARLPKFLRQTLKDRFYVSAPAPEFQNRRLSPETIQTPHAGARPRLSSTEMHQSIRLQVCNETRHQQLQQIPPPWTPETSKILVKKAWHLSWIFHVRGTSGPANSSNTLREQGTTTIRCTIRVATRPHLGKNSIQAPFFRQGLETARWLKMTWRTNVYTLKHHLWIRSMKSIDFIALQAADLEFGGTMHYASRSHHFKHLQLVRPTSPALAPPSMPTLVGAATRPSVPRSVPTVWSRRILWKRILPGTELGLASSKSAWTERETFQSEKS